MTVPTASSSDVANMYAAMLPVPDGTGEGPTLQVPATPDLTFSDQCIGDDGVRALVNSTAADAGTGRAGPEKQLRWHSIEQNMVLFRVR